jgi:hypothetical protein
VANKRKPKEQPSPFAAPDGALDRYAVGYGKPPQEYRFQPGRSGNPSGRPPKKKTLPDSDPTSAMLGMGRIAFEPVKVTQNGKVVVMPAIEAVERKRLSNALKGDNRLLQREIKQEAEEYQRQVSEAEAKRYHRLLMLKEQGEQRIAEAKSRGLPEPELLPHPKDIEIDEENLTVKIQGPETRDQLAVTKFIVALRDLCVLRATYQTRFPSIFPDQTPENIREQLVDVANTLDQALCPRLRWGPFGFSKASDSFRRVGFRFLEAKLTNALAQAQHMWSTEPALEPCRSKKRVARDIDWILRFRTRSRERVFAQRAYDRCLVVMRMAFGDAVVSKLPKRFSASWLFRSDRNSEALPLYVRQQLQLLANQMVEAGLFKLI